MAFLGGKVLGEGKNPIDTILGNGSTTDKTKVAKELAWQLLPLDICKMSTFFKLTPQDLDFF